jgi:molybdopterin/thiamine biosynthesis adenylyltransferase
MWENDRDLLHEEEADAPDPWGNYVDHVPESAILLDVPEQIGERGYLEVGFSSLSPARGSLVGLRQTHPTAKRFELSEAGRALAGEYRVQGVWQRLEEPPPDPRSFAISNWVGSEHRPLIARAQEYANGHPDPEMPTLVGFVYPNEGPGRGEYHDAWLFLLIRPNQPPEYPRPFPIGSNDAWARQPELSSLVGRSVGVVGAGALGSQVAALLARAGVRRFVLVDHDIVTPGNRVRHELDLADAGRSKTTALADRLRRIDPWCEVEERTHRLGHINAPMLGGIQASDDEVAQLLGGVDLIVNTTADSAAGHHCSKLARQEGRTALHAWVGPGAWGGRVLIQREAPERSGCTECLARWQEDPAVGNGATAVEVPELVADPAPQEVIERGCADPSFTGPGFELTAAAAAAARAAAQLLRTEDSSYPVADFDLMTLRFRSSESAQAESHYTRLPTHPRCSICHG